MANSLHLSRKRQRLSRTQMSLGSRADLHALGQQVKQVAYIIISLDPFYLSA